MNEKLTVRNFGPIEKAEVEFKRVTVFIGPTGGGKSTLAKLAAIFRSEALILSDGLEAAQNVFNENIGHFGLGSYFGLSPTDLRWQSARSQVTVSGRKIQQAAMSQPSMEEQEARRLQILRTKSKRQGENSLTQKEKAEMYGLLIQSLNGRLVETSYPELFYIPAERLFVSAIASGLAGLVVNGVALPKPLLSFVNDFNVACQDEWFENFRVPALGVTHTISDGRNRIELPNKQVIDLAESASGIQAAIPMMLVAEQSVAHGETCSFIIEEPELNLFPEVQRKILQELSHTCTQNGSDLLITTHSPYILSHLNLLLYAHQVATQYPDRADEVAKLVPRESWIDPKEFAAYYVGDGTVRSIVNAELGLIDDNELDGIAGDQADAFDNLIRLSKGFAVK